MKYRQVIDQITCLLHSIFSANKHIIPQQQEKKYQQYAKQNAFYKQLDHHSNCNPEQGKPNQSSHGIYLISFYSILCCQAVFRILFLQNVFSSSAALWIASATSGSSFVSPDVPFPAVNLFTKSGTISSIFVMLS